MSTLTLANIYITDNTITYTYIQYSIYVHHDNNIMLCMYIVHASKYTYNVQYGGIQATGVSVGKAVCTFANQ
jgi:hypothetical protein